MLHIVATTMKELSISFVVRQQQDYDAVGIMLTAHVDWFIMQLDRDVLHLIQSDFV